MWKKKKKKKSLQKKATKQGHYPKSSVSQAGVLCFYRKAHLENFARGVLPRAPQADYLLGNYSKD